jgi:hypothetical protein
VEESNDVTLLAGESLPVLEKLVSTVRTWCPVRAPAATDPYMAAAITKALGWSPDAFRPTSAFGSKRWISPSSWSTGLWPAPWNCRAVGGESTRGRRRRCTGFCRGVCQLSTRMCGIISVYQRAETTNGHTARWPEGSSRWRGRSLQKPAWAGPLEPRTPLRALDKWLWWDGGGKDSHVYMDPDPWRVVRELNLNANDPVTELSEISALISDRPSGRLRERRATFAVGHKRAYGRTDSRALS